MRTEVYKASADSSCSSVGRRLVENSAVIALCRPITVVVSLVAVPVIVQRLGMASYGIWEVALAMAGLSALVNGPISGTVLWQVSQAYGRRDSETIRRFTSAGIGLSLLLTAVCFPVLWGLRFKLVSVFHVPVRLQAEASTVLALSWAISVAGGINESLAAAIDGSQRMALTTLVRTAGRVAMYSAAIAAVVLGYGLHSLVVGQAVDFLVTVIGLSVVARRACPVFPVGMALPRLGDIRNAGRYAGLLSVGQVASALRDQTDRLVLAGLSSPVWAGYYGIAARLASLALEIGRFIYRPLTAAAGALMTSGDTVGIQRLYARAMTVIAVLTGAVVALVAGLHGQLVLAWIGKDMPQVTPLLLLLISGNAAAMMITGPGTAVCRGTSRVGLETSYIVVNLLLNLVLTVGLVLLAGPIGTVIASAVSWVLGAALFAVILYRMTDLPVSATWRSVKALGAALGAYGVARLVLSAAPVPITRWQALTQMTAMVIPLLLVYGSLLLAFGAVSRHSLLSAWRQLRGLRHQVAVGPEEAVSGVEGEL